MSPFYQGAIAQLGERNTGSVEVGGSIPPGSTNNRNVLFPSPSSRGLGHRPFTAVTGVRLPLGTPDKSMAYGFESRFFMFSGNSCRSHTTPIRLSSDLVSSQFIE